MKAAQRIFGFRSTVTLVTLLVLVPAALDGQSRRNRNRPPRQTAQAGAVSRQTPPERQAQIPAPTVPYAGPERKYPDRRIVVNLTENHVYVFDGDEVIWSAVAGTGTGLQLEAENNNWDFATPQGIMEVKRMEKDPIWVASDWYFIEKGLKVPPANDPRRRIPGVMGTTAIYLGDGIAIHGTNSPELLTNPDPQKRRVSHGCIRLTNENARELMEMVEVGTPVLIH